MLRRLSVYCRSEIAGNRQFVHSAPVSVLPAGLEGQDRDCDQPHHVLVRVNHSLILGQRHPVVSFAITKTVPIRDAIGDVELR